MKPRTLIPMALTVVVLSGCAAFGHLFCEPNCRSETHNTSSLVSFLYPDGKAPPREDTIPELRIPLRVGLAFLPPQGNNQGHNAVSLDAAHREQLMGRIHKRFADRKFIAEITEIPDYYLKSKGGFEGLEGVQRLYNVDVMALVSYDQVTHLDDNDWSLGYLTIVGAYVVKGSRHDVSTLVDLAVVDPATRSLVLRAGGTDTRHGNTTLVDQSLEARGSSADSFAAATDQMVENFDVALKNLEANVRDGKAQLRVVSRTNGEHSHGGGAVEYSWLAAFACVGLIGCGRRRRKLVR